jgi:N(2)-fixation sustaining protein CowN
MKTNEIRIDERYVSFENIDCFENACLVIDALLRVVENLEHVNLYWKKIIPTIPQAYYDRNPKSDEKEELLYLVCANVFYLEELFENADDEFGIEVLRKCELECC